MSPDFLSPAPSALARSPMEPGAQAAGARLERRDGWNVAVRFDGLDAERERCRAAAGFADRSPLGKLELQAGAGELAALAGEALEPGRAVRAGGAWWCPYTPERVLLVCEPDATAGWRERLGGAVDLTAALGALTVAGPLAREVLARFTAIDLRPAVTPVGGFRPGSVARTPGAILREGDDRWLLLFGAALGQYLWTVVADAAGALGGGPVAVDALPEPAHA